MDIKSNYNRLTVLFILLIGMLAASHALAETEDVKHTFVLSLWAPDEVPPSDAKLAEFGDSYSYQYTPEIIEFSQDSANQIVEFKFDKSLDSRYQFRWLTADYPQYTTLSKMKSHKMHVRLSEMPLNQDIYFEVWVLDTHTGKVFMCDPQIRNKGKL